jgi:CheY-like chemotaxis protein
MFGDKHTVFTVLTRKVERLRVKSPFLDAVRRPVRRGPASSLSRVKVGCFALLDSHRRCEHARTRFNFEPDGAWRVCGEAENGELAVEKVKEPHPDVVILDFQMPVMNGREAARQIALLAPNTTMVMLTMHDCEQLSKDAQAAGIKEVLSKSDGIADHLIASLRSVVPTAGI